MAAPLTYALLVRTDPDTTGHGHIVIDGESVAICGRVSDTGWSYPAAGGVVMCTDCVSAQRAMIQEIEPTFLVPAGPPPP